MPTLGVDGIKRLWCRLSGACAVVANGYREWSRLAAKQAQAIFPGQWTRGSAWANVTPPPGSSLHTLTTRSGPQIKALFAPAALDASTTPARRPPTILFFYGNDMCLRISVQVLQLLRKLSVNVMIPEYVGYGMSQGVASERACYETADAAFEFLRDRPEVDPERVIVAGCSLGGAVAIDLAARRKVAGLATLVTFTNLPDMARRFYPGWIVRIALRSHFHSLRKIRKVRCPTLIGHSTGDQFIPFEMADRLAAAAAGPVTRLTIEGAQHNSASVLASGSQVILDEFGRFVRQCDDTARARIIGHVKAVEQSRTPQQAANGAYDEAVCSIA